MLEPREPEERAKRASHREPSWTEPVPVETPGRRETWPDAPSLEERLRGMPGLATLVAEAEATWRTRAAGAGVLDPAAPGWRTFEDAFPTFYEFTNRPR